ncbi:YrdC-like domain-containing protein [Meloidogyne graminicola]|uniref:Threonylcarbamoyl-AMP synthase n=1 Tax=Meloidogyne graminicola TaxID=189291 RepID=A0A8T0A5L4_9BILA|nr:YrdC-like domain-containing protein [Meloidogyne graminicola]
MLKRSLQYFVDLRGIYKLEKLRLRRKRMGTGSNIVKLNPLDNAAWFKAVQDAVKCLKSGGIIAVPTDTLYGLCTLIENSDRLYKLKKRPNGKPLGIFINDGEDVFSYAERSVPNGLVKSLFPGPVTLIFNRSEKLPSNFNCGTQSVGFRIPQARFVRDICRFLPYRLIAQTSANVSGTDLNPICIEDFQELWDEIDMIIDGGTILENNMSRLGSTVVDLSLPGHAEQETINTLHEYGLKSVDEIQREKIEAKDKIKPMIENEEERNNEIEEMSTDRPERLVGNN